MTQHDPGVWPQYGNVVGNVLGIGRPHANVDHGDTCVVGTHQVIARHLRQAWWLLAQGVGRLGLQPHTSRHHIARLDKSNVFAGGVGHGGVPQGDEFVNVELVVGEQHKVLKMLRTGSGVMPQPVQRVIHPGRGKQRQGFGLAGAWLVGAVGNAVVHGGQVGQVENVAHPGSPLCRQVTFYMVVFGKREVHRYGLRAGAHLQLHAVVLQQQVELVQVVVRIQVRPSQRGLKSAGSGHKAVAQARTLGGDGARNRVGMDAHHGVAGPHMAHGIGAAHEVLHGLAQVVNAAVVDAGDLGQG